MSVWLSMVCYLFAILSVRLSVCLFACLHICMVSVSAHFSPSKLNKWFGEHNSDIFQNVRCFTGRMGNHLETRTHTGTLWKERNLAQPCYRTAFITGGKTLQNMN